MSMNGVHNVSISIVFHTLSMAWIGVVQSEVKTFKLKIKLKIKLKLAH